MVFFWGGRAILFVYAGGEFRTRDLQIMSIALVGELLEFTK